MASWSGWRCVGLDDAARSGGTETAGRLVVPNDHNCFGCGRLNATGLRLTFYAPPDRARVWAPFTPNADHEGFQDMVHGGIITAVLDEVMGWALYARGIWAVTGKLSVAFRRPVEVGVATRATGWLVADRGRVLDVAGELRRETDAAVLAEASATFARVPEEQARAWRERYLGNEDAEA